MQARFSIAFLLMLLLVSAIGVRLWQVSQPMDHFALDIAGELVPELPADTRIKVLRNPDHHRRDEYVLELSELPATISNEFAETGCVAEFWSADRTGQEERLFSIVVDRELFDEFRVITLRLDRPTPQLKPTPGFWPSLRWSPNITRRLRYLELPWWDRNLQKLAPCPSCPELVARRMSNGELIEQRPVERQRCEFEYWYGEFGEDKNPNLRNGETVLFSVTYDSGGLFDPIQTDFEFRYDSRRHGVW